MQYFDHGGDIYNNDIELDFSISCNPLGIPENAVSFIKNNIEKYVSYPDPNCTKLRKFISAFDKIPAENIVCGNGASDLLMRICAAICPKKVLVTAPTFSDYERCSKLYGAEVKYYNLLERNHFDVNEKIIEVLDDDIDILFLCNPNNPTGKIISHDLLKRILMRCEALHILLVIDECFLPFTEEKTMMDYSISSSNLIVLRAFTKIYTMAGIRLGYMTGNKELLAKIKSFGPEWNVSSIAQDMGIQCLLSEPSWSKSTQMFCQRELQFLSAELKKLGFTTFQTSSNYILVKASSDTTLLYQKLIENKILIRNCDNFRGLDSSYFRIAVRAHNDNVKLIHTLGEING